ncbi:MAG: hypothetical protein COU51_01115 [Parcubacteria group bacterium CG10_big_fil_rev_8_21_14_0_10_36_14]|nr:MAG: hypothetical protein COU51_01115 [Parcubacteria group bacterium CG10_big_fil_rev_8_21_14_0_10_36_14]
MSEDIFEKLNKLPEKIKEYMYSDSLADANLELIEKYKFSETQKEDFFDILNQIFVKEMSPDSLDGVLMNKLKIKDDKIISALAGEIREKILTPIADYFGMSEAREINKEGDNVLVAKSISKFNLQFALPDLKERFTDISGSFLENVRTKSQFKNTLGKPIDMGGMGYDNELAENIAKFFGSYMRIQEIEKKKEKEGAIPKTRRIKSLDIKEIESPSIFSSPLKKGDIGGFKNPPQPSFSKGGSEDAVFSVIPAEAGTSTKNDEVGFTSEEKEVEEMKQRVEEIRGSEPHPVTESKTDEAIKEVDIKFPSVELNDRLRALVDSRLRNVRTSTQTFERLTLPVKQGGLGISKEEADRISLALNKYLDKESHDLYKGKVGEIKKFEKKVSEQKIEKDERENRQQQEGLNKKFEKLIARRRIKKTRKQESTRAQEKLLRKSLPSEKGGQEGFNNESSPSLKKGDIGGFINPPQPSFSKEGGVKPTLEDIAYKSKLYGPVEEIANMTFEDFRRISKDPKEAILKIKDKLALLREESFTKYQTGVTAWKKSPLYKEYLKLLNESLASGKSLEESLLSNQALNKEEFDAIIDSRIE